MASKLIVPIARVSRSELQAYINELQASTGLFAMIQESFKFTFKYYEGITAQDMATIIRSTSEPQLISLMRETPLVGGGGTFHTDNNETNGSTFCKSFFAFKRNADGITYNVAYAHASQTKAVNWEKFGFTLGIATIAGIVVGVLMPVAGLAVGTVLATGAAGKTTYDRQFKTMSNVICGYIGKELSDRNLLAVVD